MAFYGLQANYFTQNNSLVTLERTSADVSITGFVAHLAIKLIYRNCSSKALEVSYSCPVDSKASVYSFEAKLDGRTIIGQCLEKKKAQLIYQEAVQQGSTAILGAENPNAGDIFHLSLGNFPAGEIAELGIKIVTELPVETDGCVTFTIPTVFRPRYFSSPSLFTNYAFCPPSYSDGVSPVRTQYSLDVKAKVHGSLKISRITSAAHPVIVELSDDCLTADITQDVNSSLNHDWSIKIYYQTPHQATALQMAGDRTGKGIMKDDAIMVNLFPEVPLEGFNPHKELIILIDRSGSMEGPRIEKAKNTLLFLLKSLPHGCLFNIISFGSKFSTLFERSKRYSEETLNEALLLHKHMDADMGGTEILRVLKFIFSEKPTLGYPRQVIVLTDGAVWNQDQVFELIRSFAHEARVFSVGIGEGASTALVRGMAEAGRGRCEMVLHEDQLQMKVMGLLANMLQNPIKYLKIQCEVEPSQPMTLVPKMPRCLFGGQQLIVYGRVRPNTQVKSLKMTWRVESKEVVCEIPETQIKVVHDSNYSFHRLAAKAQIKQWELEDTGNLEDMIELSVSSDVVCKATSFVGVDNDGTPVKEKIRTQFPFVFQIPSNSLFSFANKGPNTLNNNNFQSGYDTLKHPAFFFTKNTSQPHEFQHFKFGSVGGQNSPNKDNSLFGSVPIKSAFDSPLISNPQSQQTSPFTFGCSQSIFRHSTPSLFGSIPQDFAVGNSSESKQIRHFSFGSTQNNTFEDKKTSNFACNIPFSLQPPQFSFGVDQIDNSGKKQPNYFENKNVPSPHFSSFIRNTPQSQQVSNFKYGTGESDCSRNKNTMNLGITTFGSPCNTPMGKTQPSQSFTFGFGKTVANKEVAENSGTNSFGTASVSSLKNVSHLNQAQSFKFGTDQGFNLERKIIDNEANTIFSLPPTSSFGSTSQSQLNQPFTFGSNQNQDLENKKGNKLNSNTVMSAPSPHKETGLSQKQFLSNFKSAEDTLLKIVEAQLFDGSWKFESCLEFIPASQDNLRRIQSQISLDDICFATAVTLAYIETSFSSRRQEWILLHNKGKQFLQSKKVDALIVIEKCSNELQRLSGA